METSRFETFFDAIIAIIITVLVLKIPQPTIPTLSGLLELQKIYVAYFISFLVLYNIWYSNHEIFRLVDHIDNKTLWLYETLTFVISLIPYFTLWLAYNIYSIPAETMFGLLFIVTHIFYTLSTWTISKTNPYSEIQEKNFIHLFNQFPVIILIIGFILTYTVYTPGIYISCLLSVILWIVIEKALRRHENGN